MRLVRTFLLILGAGVMLTGIARAADQDVKVTLRQNFLYDSNPQMLTTGEKSLRQSSTTPTIAFASKTPLSFLNLDATVTQNIANLDGYDTTDGKASAKIGTKSQEWQVSLGASGTYDTTHSSELTTLGQSSTNDRRTNAAITPAIAYLPSERDRIDLSGSYEQTNYDSRLYTDYHLSGITLDYTRALSEQHSVFLSTAAQRYQAQEHGRNRTDMLAPSIGWQADWTEVMKTRLSAGAQASQRTLGSLKQDWEWGQIYEASLLFDGTQNQASVTLSRESQPLVNGTTTMLTGLKIKENYRINTSLALTFDGAAYHGGSDNHLSGDLKTRFEAAPGLGYQFNKAIGLNVRYRYRQEELYDRPQNAQSQTAILGLTFKP